MPKAAKVTRVEHKKVEHTPATLPYTENVPPALFLRTAVGDGKTKDGREIEISMSGASIIISVGGFTGGRQFLVNVAELVTAVLQAQGIE